MMYFVLQTLNGFSVLVATIATLTTVGLSFALDNDGSDANTGKLIVRAHAEIS
jgi:hypothetical protein